MPELPVCARKARLPSVDKRHGRRFAAIALHKSATFFDTAVAAFLLPRCKTLAHSQRNRWRSATVPDAVAMHSACRRAERGLFVRKRLI